MLTTCYGAVVQGMAQLGFKVAEAAGSQPYYPRRKMTGYDGGFFALHNSYGLVRLLGKQVFSEKTLGYI